MAIGFDAKQPTEPPSGGPVRATTSAPVASAPVAPPGSTPARPERTSQPAIPLPPEAAAVYGLVRQRSQYPVGETARRLTALVRAQGLKIFGDIDFAGDAGRAGMTIRPMRQIVFGNPSAGTPLIVAAPTVALDLPLRVLIYEDGRGAVWLAYNDAEYLRERHQLPDGLLGNIAVLPELVARALGTEVV